jgi:hypothetical protein
MHPARRYRNLTGSFNKYLQSLFPGIVFNFSEAEFDTANLSKWVQVEYISRTLDVKAVLIVQLSMFAKDDRFGTKVGELCDQVMDTLCGDQGSNDLRTIPVKDWFSTDVVKPQVSSLWVKPRQINKPVVDQYGVTMIAATVELRQARP